MYTRDEILSYHCPRWNEWPSIDLYMDQVISLVEENVTLFYSESDTKPVTSTMINNYVKQKIIIPSKKKRYQREHLADLYIVFLLKPVLSLTDICNGITSMRKQHSSEEAYNLFCEEIEAALCVAFDGNRDTAMITETESGAVKSIALAFAYTVLARYQLFTETTNQI